MNGRENLPVGFNTPQEGAGFICSPEDTLVRQSENVQQPLVFSRWSLEEGLWKSDFHNFHNR